MLKWIDVLKLARNGNLKPDRRLEKSEAEWKTALPADVFQVARM